MAARGDVEHAVVGGHEDALPRTQAPREGGDRGVEHFECFRPLGRLPAPGMRELVELRHIEIGQSGPAGAERLRRRIEPLPDGAAADVLGPAQDGGGETGLRVLRQPDRPGGDSGIARAFEDGRRPLPGRRVELVVPAAQLIDVAVVRGVAHAVADEAVLPGGGAGRERRQRRRRRGRGAGIDRGRRSEQRRECTGMPRPGPQGGCPETVDHDHHHMVHGRETQQLGLASQRGEGTWQNSGKARFRRESGR